jgi:hypothetical protein
MPMQGTKTTCPRVNHAVNFKRLDSGFRRNDVTCASQYSRRQTLDSNRTRSPNVRHRWPERRFSDRVASLYGERRRTESSTADG